MKLTRKIRDRIVDDLMAHAFKGEKDKLKKAEGVLAVAAYDERYSKEQRAAMEVLGTDLLYTTSSVTCYLAPQTKGKHRSYDHLTLDGEARLATPKAGGYTLSAALSKRVRALRAEQEKLHTLEMGSRSNARGILDSVTTVKRLIEVWPEVEAFVPKTEAAATNLPAVRLDKINQMLGLPPETKQ